MMLRLLHLLVLAVLIFAAADVYKIKFDSTRQAERLAKLRQEIRRDEKAPKGRDKVVVKDPNAPLLWARFYEIGRNRPIFSGRDGIAKRELADIGYERRNGYAWLGTWPQKVLDDEYPAWKKKVVSGK